jgi:hypothetical protein
MDGQLGTRDGSSGRPGALLEISFPTQNSSTPYLNIRTVFVTGEDKYSRYNYRDTINLRAKFFFQIMTTLAHFIKVQTARFSKTMNFR